MKKLQKTCATYVDWKNKNSPNLKPWLYPEQQTLPRVDPNKCKPQVYKDDDDLVDESNLDEKDMKYATADDVDNQNGDIC